MLMRAQVAMVCLFLLVSCGGSSTNTDGGGGHDGSSGAATCAQCDKAQTCCVAVVGAASCTLSTSACNALSGQNQMSYAMSCQSILQAGASGNIAACM
jgi:hypothetical protein